MHVNTVKRFLKVDFDDDDDYIELCIQAAKEYVKNTVGKPALNAQGNVKENDALVNLLVLTLCTEFYDRRSFTVDKANEKVRYTIRSITRQLELGGADDE